MLSFSLVAEALTGLIYHRPSGENSKFLPSSLPRKDSEDSDVDFEASRRSTRVQSKSTIRSALFLARHYLDRSLDCAHIRVWFWTVARLRTCPDLSLVGLSEQIC